MGIAPAATDAAPFTDAERADILEHRVRDHVRRRMVVLSRSLFSAQLVGHRFGAGTLDDQRGIYVSVEPDGQTLILDSGGNADMLPPPRRR